MEQPQFNLFNLRRPSPKLLPEKVYADVHSSHLRNLRVWVQNVALECDAAVVILCISYVLVFAW